MVALTNIQDLYIIYVFYHEYVSNVTILILERILSFQIIQEDFVEIRKVDSKSMSVDDFHSLLNIVRFVQYKIYLQFQGIIRCLCIAKKKNEIHKYVLFLRVLLLRKLIYKICSCHDTVQILLMLVLETKKNQTVKSNFLLGCK